MKWICTRCGRKYSEKPELCIGTSETTWVCANEDEKHRGVVKGNDAEIPFPCPECEAATRDIGTTMCVSRNFRKIDD